MSTPHASHIISRETVDLLHLELLFQHFEKHCEGRARLEDTWTAAQSKCALGDIALPMPAKKKTRSLRLSVDCSASTATTFCISWSILQRPHRHTIVRLSSAPWTGAVAHKNNGLAKACRASTLVSFFNRFRGCHDTMPCVSESAAKKTRYPLRVLLVGGRAQLLRPRERQSAHNRTELLQLTGYSATVRVKIASSSDRILETMVPFFSFLRLR